MQFKSGDKNYDGFCLLDGDGNPINNSNPISTFLTIGSSALSTALLRQNVFLAHGVNVGASAGNLSKMELWNPANSGKLLLVYNAWMWHTSGSVNYKASISTSQLSTNESAITKQNMVGGSSVTSLAKIYTKNDDATSAVNIFSQLAVTATAPNGTNIMPIFQGVALPGYGIRIESLTANMAINGLLVWAEIDLNDLPDGV